LRFSESDVSRFVGSAFVRFGGAFRILSGSVCVCVFIATRCRVSCSSTSRGLCMMFHSFASVLKKKKKFKSIRARKFQEG
jgi:hypothetical protein